ncbi:MAG TPA: helix-turn-helix domain-containing protein [Wenzhouxiangellaceae bacterium]|nr:helix-turn-helix domain-containing protein [Wenzhouxiangellaceae bacterium]
MTEAETPDNSNSQPSPGAALSRARRARQLSLVETASQLKLPRTTVEHIEADQFDRIAPIYRRGYIVNYARLVELDPQPLLEQMGELEPEPLRAVLPVSGKPQRFDRFLKFATYALVTTMIVPPLVYFFVLGGARLFESEVASRAVDGSGVQTPEAHKPGYRERFVDALAVQPPETTQNDASHLSASALPMNPIRAVTQSEPVAEIAGDSAAGALSPEVDPMTRLDLVLSDDSWIEIESADGQRLEFDLLRSGESRRYSGRAPFRLLLGRASAVSLSLDGQPVAFEGQNEAGVAELVIGEPQPDPTAVDSGGGPPSE